MSTAFDLIVRNAQAATAADLFRCDIGITGGRITALGESLQAGPNTREIDAAGRFVTPGGVDSHCHIDQPMLPPVRMADDFETGTRSAACGGTTTVIPFAAQQKGQGVQAAVDDYHRRAEGKASVDYAFHLIVSDPTPMVMSEELPSLIDKGYTSFKLYMTYEDMKLDDRQILELLEVARLHGAMVMVHAENTDAITYLTERLLAVGKTAPRFHGLSRPSPVEREATHRAITLAELVDVPILLVHVSGAEAVEQIRWARGKGLNVFAETCPQYLFLTQDDLALPGFHGARCVCSPPPRDKANQQVIWDGLADGLFTVLSSDHAPFNYDNDAGGKRLGGREPEFPYIPNGVPGIETRMGLLFSEGVLTGRLTLQQFVALTATNAARLYGLYPRKGTIAVGSDADLVVWDTGMPYTIRNEALHHAADYTPYEGRELQAWPAMTLLRGEVVWDGKRFLGRAGAGQFLHCERPEAARPRPREQSWRRWVEMDA
ncbi:dihydropyrimidinase [Piscinibacter gummiphilus]|uniref:Dihydropyrimidinase n=1 Tax=Piscinibacter gummiphilus TaxID=946333 RepID=A0ABZ0CMU1_9BURK|nr:dihydropyrimidinase [Piscinibacter gummiphilus]WOB06204.1 dihydropyrimidinase [Piscinibacter gummiphilus]